MSFDGRVVLITGGGSGIGAATAILLSKQGASVIIVGRNREKLRGVAEQIITADGAEPLEIVADINVDAERIIGETIDKFGKLDVLVNNAGIMASGSIGTGSIDALDEIWNTNVRSVYQLTQLAVPHLIEAKGNIVNVSSMLSVRPCQGYLAYSMSKAALDHFTRCVAMELASSGVRVNGINPGLTETPFVQTMLNDADAAAAYFDHSRASYPLGRLGTANDMAEAIAFLASDKSSFVTGHLLLVDGGKHNLCPI